MDQLDKLEEKVKTDLTWLQKHERLLIAVFALSIVLYLGNLWIIKSAANADAKVVATQQALAEQKEINASLKAEVENLQAQYLADKAERVKQDTILLTAISNRNIVVEQQKQVDKTSSLPDLAKRWQTLASVQPLDMDISSAGINVTDTGARQTVVALEDVPVLKQNLVDQTKVSDDRQQEINKADQLIGSLNNRVDGLNLQIKKQDDNCIAEVNKVKADARKSKRNWFIKGAAVGATIVSYILIR